MNVKAHKPNARHTKNAADYCTSFSTLRRTKQVLYKRSNQRKQKTITKANIIQFSCLKKKKRKKKVKTKENKAYRREMELFAECLPREYKGKKRINNSKLPLHANRDPGWEKPGSIRGRVDIEK